MVELLELPQIECSGSPRELGRAQGEALRERIAGFVAGRHRSLAGYLAKRGRDDARGFVEAGARCLQLAAGWDPLGTAEHHGIAEGANVDPAELYAIANLSDLRDLLLLSGASDPEGCSALLVAPERSRTRSVIAAQTWDLGPADLEAVVAVHRRPNQGPETWSVTCAGCLTLIGVSAAGLAVGTTNIKTRGCRPGVGYLSVLHRAIRADDVASAAAVVRDAPRIAAHTYWLADGRQAVELECGPTQCFERRLGQQLLRRTNHCLAPELVAIEGEPPTRSSRRRLERLAELTEGRALGPDELRELFADRADGIDSVARLPEDGEPTATNATVVCLPAERKLIACRGPSQRGRWVELGLG